MSTSTDRDPADLLADRFAAQVRERTGFQGPRPDSRPAGAGFEFGRGPIEYAVVLHPPGSVVVRIKNGAELASWTVAPTGAWKERMGDRVADQGTDLAIESADIATRLFDWIERQS
jgi:hypothetical protein